MLMKKIKWFIKPSTYLGWIRLFRLLDKCL